MARGNGKMAERKMPEAREAVKFPPPDRPAPIEWSRYPTDTSLCQCVYLYLQIFQIIFQTYFKYYKQNEYAYSSIMSVFKLKYS